MKGKLSLTNLRKVYSGQSTKTGLVDEEKAVDIFYLVISLPLSTVFQNILRNKLIKYGTVKWTVRWTEASAILWFW